MDYKEIVDKTREYSELVIDLLSPKMIVLYGSYAKGTAREDSDIDIAIILDTLGEDFLERAHQLFKLRRGIDSRIEPVLIGLDNDKSGFCEDILKTGKIIYTA